MESSKMTHESLPVTIYEDSRQACNAVAGRIAELIRERADVQGRVVLGLATGHTPINIYCELIRLHREEGLDLSGVVTFNLDEYWPIDPEAIQSYHTWMQENFFGCVNIRPENIHIPPADIAEDQVDQCCRDYEDAIRAAGGIDIQILGIGRSGHIGFNEPGSGRASRTRRIRLDKLTRMDAAGDFFGEEYVPEMGITMGVATILDAREVYLLAFGEQKAPIVRRTVEGDVSDRAPASFLQEHSCVRVCVDADAAAELTRVLTPWFTGSCVWDEALQRRATIWLARKLKKPILKLTDEDYGENGLGELMWVRGGYYQLNIDIFRQLMETITGWPAGRTPRRVLVLSPHPDDDVICMGGTIARLVSQGHEVHVAYMVSGYLSVFDHDVMRYADFATEFNRIFGLTADQMGTIEEHIEEFLRNKRPGEIDSPQIQSIKGLIRRGEAIDAARYCGVSSEHIHFLDMPFYDTGKVQKSLIGPNDVAAVRRAFETSRPDIVFAAGDMSDPHGTHRLCLEAALAALDEHREASGLEPELWLYRGAWQEWAPEQIEMAVPLSPEELKEKRYAIFRHQSQKDRAMFPGPYDRREFWQRAEDRNMATAALYDQLGLPEYHAIEAFARWPIATRWASGTLDKP
jgi:glucosamine-6-phosphate deaminase